MCACFVDDVIVIVIVVVNVVIVIHNVNDDVVDVDC